MNKNFWQSSYPWLGLAIIATLISMGPVVFNGWVNWDDDGYVLNNQLVQYLTWSQIVKMFNTLQVVGSYHPLTLLSLAIDYAIAGKEPMVYHLNNLLLHLLNVVLVFLFVRSLSGRAEVAGLTAILFGIHPMHLESVAWVSARKDLLYTAFYIGALMVYLQYLKRKEGKRWRFYAGCMILFLLSLLSKGLAITLPFVMLLIDYFQGRENGAKVILEKIPFLVLSFVFLVIGYLAQKDSGAMHDLTEYPIHQTIFNGTYTLLLYLVKSIIPFKLSPFHPFPFDHVSNMPWYFYISIVPFTLLIIIAGYSARFNRKFIFGIGFFFITVLPTLQFIPYGRAMIGERYTYVSYIGLFYVIALSLTFLYQKVGSRRQAKIALISVLVIYFFTLGFITHGKCKIWKNGGTLWHEVIRKYPDDFFAYCNLADYWKQKGEADLALSNMNRCVELSPGLSDSYLERGRLYKKRSQPDLALADFNKAISLDASSHKSYLNRAMLLFTNFGEPQNALADLDSAITIKRDYANAYLNKGVILEELKDYNAALNVYSQGIEVVSNNARLYRYRAVVNLVLQNEDAAIADLSRAIMLNPVYGEAYFLRSKAYNAQGDAQAAFRDAVKARELNYEVDDNYMRALKRAVDE